MWVRQGLRYHAQHIRGEAVQRERLLSKVTLTQEPVSRWDQDPDQDPGLLSAFFLSFQTCPCSLSLPVSSWASS